MLASVRAANESGAARRRQRRLRQWLRHERLSVAMALAEFSHHSAPRGQKKARAGGGAREDVHGEAPDEAPPPEEPDTQYYGLDDNDSVPELSGGRPGPVLDPGPPVAGERHSGVGYEILLDVRVLQLGRDTKDFPHVMELYFWEQLWRHGVVSDSAAARRLAVDVPKHKAEYEQPVQVARGSRSSNKVGGRRKRKKRRKKKLPKTSSSTSSRCRERNQGAVEYAEDGEDEVTIEYEQRAGVLRIHTANTFTLHAEPLNSFHCKEVTGYTGPGEAAPGMEEVHKYFEDKVIRVMGEETNLKNGTPAEQTLSAKTVKDVIWLLFDDSLDLGLQLGRINAVFGYIHRMIKIGQRSIDDDDEKLGDEDGLKFKMTGPGGKSCMTGRMLNSSNSAGVWALHEVYFDVVRGRPRDGWRLHEVSEVMDLAPRG